MTHFGHRTRTNRLPVTVEPHSNGRGQAWLEVAPTDDQATGLANHIAGRLAAQRVIGRATRPAEDTIRRAILDYPAVVPTTDLEDLLDRLAEEMREQASVAEDAPWTAEDEGDVIATARIEDRA